MWIVRNFQIVTVSAVKICKQILQTASASGDFVPQTPTDVSPLDPTGGPQTFGLYSPNENSWRRYWKHSAIYVSARQQEGAEFVFWTTFHTMICI